MCAKTNLHERGVATNITASTNHRCSHHSHHSHHHRQHRHHHYHYHHHHHSAPVIFEPPQHLLVAKPSVAQRDYVGASVGAFACPRAAAQGGLAPAFGQ